MANRGRLRAKKDCRQCYGFRAVKSARHGQQSSLGIAMDEIQVHISREIVHITDDRLISRNQHSDC